MTFLGGSEESPGTCPRSPVPPGGGGGTQKAVTLESRSSKPAGKVIASLDSFEDRGAPNGH
jgi:hypothetical protein